MRRKRVLSRHRLPRFYRVGLTVGWLLSPLILSLSLILRLGFAPSLLDPRFLLLALGMTLPAFYVWREGVDVLPDGIIARVHLPRYYTYDCLAAWHLDAHPDRRVLTVWDVRNRKALECRAGHLTDLPVLLAALQARVRRRDAAD